MTDTNARPESAPHPRPPAPQEGGLPAFLVDAHEGTILASNAAAARLGLTAGALASTAVLDRLRALAQRASQRPCLVRLRPPYGVAAHTFRCVPDGNGALVFTALDRDAEQPAHTSAPAAAAPIRSDQGSAPLRFNFEADADGRLTWIAPALAGALGPDARRLLGATFAELETAGLLHGAAAAHAALTGGQTFSGVRVAVSDDAPFDLPYDLELGGVPLVGAGRAPAGVRGFGIAWPRPRRTAPAADAPSAPTPGPAPSATPIAAPPPAPLPTPRRPDAEKPGDGKVVALRSAAPLTPNERSAFQEIARTLSAAVEGWQNDPPGMLGAPMEDAAPRRTSPDGAQAAHPFPLHDVASPEPALLDRLPVGLLVQQNGEVVHANGTFRHWTGHRDLDSFIQSGGLAGALERDTDGQLRLITGTGARLPVDVRLLAAPFRGRNALIYVVRRLDSPPSPVAQGLRQQEQAAARREALHLVPWPLLLLEADGHVLFANAAATRLLEMEEDALVGALFLVAVAPQDRPAAVAALDRALEAPSDGPVIQTLTLHTAAGGLPRARAAFGPGGTEDRLVCLVLAPESDLEWEPARAPEVRVPAFGAPGAAESAPASELARDDIAPTPATPPVGESVELSRLAQLLTDQLATPLSLVLSDSPGAADQLDLSDDARAALARIRGELEDLATLARSVPPADTAVSDLAQVTRAALDHLIPAARRRGVRLRADLVPAAPVAAPEPRLARLVRLMVEDALTHSPAGTSITVGVERQADGAFTLSVGDAGPALDEVAAAQARNPLPDGHGPDPAESDGPVRQPGLLRWARLEREADDLGGAFTIERGLPQGLIARLRLPGAENS